MSGPDQQHAEGASAEVAREIATEQAHVDRVYAELAKAAARLGAVEGRRAGPGPHRTAPGTCEDEELTGLFE